MVAQRVDYTADAVQAARSVLLELSHLLGEYRDDVVVIGGWVPDLLLSRGLIQHIGSMDVDLALNHQTLQEAGYQRIEDLLLGRGYRLGKQPFIYHRTVRLGDRDIDVQVDFLAGEYAGTGEKHRTQQVQGIHARKARGADLSFELSTEVVVEGRLPDGAKDTTRVRVASIVSFLVMKGMALRGRLKEKDAWDIYFCVRNYPGGVEALATEFQSHDTNGLVQEGLKNIAEKFASPSHVGPTQVADFEGVTDPNDRDLIRRDAYERVADLLRRLGIS